MKSGKENNYPKAPALELDFDLMTPDETEEFVADKIGKILEAEKLPDEKLPPCSDEERWYNEPKKTYLRCAKYCDVATFCQQLRKEKEREAIPAAEEVEVVELFI